MKLRHKQKTFNFNSLSALLFENYWKVFMKEDNQDSVS